VFLISLLGLTFSSFTALRQVDLKRIIAYASISHMHFVMFGLFSFNFLGLSGSLFLMFSHSFVASLLFFLVGYLYEFYGSRLIFYYSGLLTFMPYFCFILFIALLANLGFPGTCGFVGEFLILLSFVSEFLFLSFFFFFFFFFNCIYFFWLYTRLSYDSVSFNFISKYSDILHFYHSLFNSFLFLIIFLGLFPNVFLLFIEQPVFYFLLLPF